MNEQTQSVIAVLIVCAFVLCTSSMPDNSDSIDYREKSMQGFEKVFPIQNQE